MAGRPLRPFKVCFNYVELAGDKTKMLNENTQPLTSSDVDIKYQPRTVEILTGTAAFLVFSLALYLTFFDSAAPF